MTDYTIRTQHLTRDFGTVRAVDNLTLDVPSGIVFGLLGPDGSGKTTTIQMLLGLLESTGGSAQVLGYDVTTEAGKIRARTGALLAHNPDSKRLTAQEHLELYGRIYRLPVGNRQTRIEELLTRVGLWERRHDLVRDWSRAMRQTLAVACAVLQRPPLVILDEPSAGLDPAAAVALRQNLKELIAYETVTVLLATRDLAEAEMLCEQVGILCGGRLVAVGPVDTLCEQYQFRLQISGHNFNEGILSALRAYPEVQSVKRLPPDNLDSLEHLVVVLRQPADPTPLVNAIVSAGGQIAGVRHAQPALEDILRSLASNNADTQHPKNCTGRNTAPPSA